MANNKNIFKERSNYYGKWKKVYNLKSNVSQKVFQKSYIHTVAGQSTVIYGLQMKPQVNKVGWDMRLSKGITDVAPQDADNVEVAMNQYMNLTRFGHGQTFEYFEWNGKPYAWVMTKAGTEAANKDANGDVFATQVARLPLDGIDKESNLEVDRTTNLSSANDTGSAGAKPKFKLYRADAALSSDRTRLAILAQNKSGTKQLTCYDTERLNQALDAAAQSSGGVGSISCADKDMQTKKTGTNQGILISSYDASNIKYPNDSWQGLELSNSIANGNLVYLTSGQRNDPTIRSCLVSLILTK